MSWLARQVPRTFDLWIDAAVDRNPVDDQIFTLEVVLDPNCGVLKLHVPNPNILAFDKMDGMGTHLWMLGGDVPMSIHYAASYDGDVLDFLCMYQAAIGEVLLPGAGQ